MNLCLGIEATAHTFGVAVVSFEGKVLSNERDMFTTTSGGMVPMEVAKHHEEVKEKVLGRALVKAGVSLKDISLISYSHGPGLGPSLLVGMRFANSISEKHIIPVIGANHAMAHLTIGNLMCKVKDPVYLYVSGVNTQIIARTGDRYRIFGETLDIGLGNALDKLGRHMGMGFPAGPKIEQTATEGEYHELAYSIKGMDVSFAGMVTRGSQLFDKGVPVSDICYSFQETAFAMLAEIAERALAHVKKKDLLLIGGVAANKRLSKMLNDMCEARGAKFYAAPMEYAGDQAAMIAWQGILNHKGGKKIKKLDVYPYERIDEIEVVW
jgi:glycoprotease/Kae1 family metallohydrolase